ncbi:hypothetical protein [Streptomyces sp. NBC_01465]|uniref:hypothetical protein n=1 Tax=Streptomyces sp. NBC_01465 TaxID=2903878 RepID=UPI002E37756A|nr:hypothetical protein [Streptomyces sp. NBC_01465]
MAEPRLLIWRDTGHFDRFNDRPCTLCGKATPLRSQTNEPVHKVCAEAWNAAYPEAPRHRSGKRDLGTVRFHDDAPTTAKQPAARSATPPSTRTAQPELLLLASEITKE